MLEFWDSTWVETLRQIIPEGIKFARQNTTTKSSTNTEETTEILFFSMHNQHANLYCETHLIIPKWKALKPLAYNSKMWFHYRRTLSSVSHLWTSRTLDFYPRVTWPCPKKLIPLRWKRRYDGCHADLSRRPLIRGWILNAAPLCSREYTGVAKLIAYNSALDKNVNKRNLITCPVINGLMNKTISN